MSSDCTLSLQSQDGIESILDRLIVAMSNSVMACHARAAETRDPRAIDVNLRGAEKGSKALIGLVEARERRRNPKQFVVEKLNVEQAILANFETPSVRSADESQVEPSLDSDASGSDNEGIGEK